MKRIIPISEARESFSEIVKETAEEDIVIVRHGRPIAVIVSYDSYEKTLELIDDLEDEIAVLTREHDTVPFVRTTERQAV